MSVPVTLGRAWKPARTETRPHKLYPPALEGLVSRSRLLRKLDEASGVITIIDKTTSGKTSLVASWTRSELIAVQNIDVFWYQVTKADGDVATFFRLMDQAFDKRLTTLPPAYSAESSAKLASFTIEWFKSLSKIVAKPIAFVFDDVHLLSPNASFFVVLSGLARTLGERDRLILISRKSIPAHVTDAARRRQRLTRITDLRVEPSEFSDFEKSASNAEPLTQGVFIAALKAARQSMAELPLVNMMGLPASAVRQRMTEMLETLSDAERAALKATAYLQVGFEKDWRSLGGKLAATLLADKKISGGLVRRLQNNALRKHDIFFAELQNWVEDHASAAEIAEYRSATGRFLLDQGEILGGVLLLAEADAVEETTAAVLNHAGDLIDQAKNTELLNIIDILPVQQQVLSTVQLWAAYARLPYHPDEASATLAAIRTTHHRALTVSERALAINGEIYAALTTMVVDGRMPPLIEAASELVVELTAVTEPTRSRLYIGQLVALLLGAPTYHGHANARAEAKTLLSELPPEGRLILGSALVTHLLWWEGNLEAARTLHQELAGQAHRLTAAHLPVISWHVGALGLAFRDGDEKALTKALKELEQFARRRGLDSRLAPAYWVATQAYAALGNRAAALKALEKHLALIQGFRQLHEHEEHFLQSSVGLGDGDFKKAAMEAHQGWSIAKEHGALQGQRQNAVLLAMSLAFKGDDAAREAIDEVAQVGDEMGNRIFLLQAALAKAALAHAKKRWTEFDAAWEDVTRISLAIRIRSLTGINIDIVGRLARDALLRTIKPNETAQLVTLWRLLPPADAAAVAGWPYPLEISGLGRHAIDLTAHRETGSRIAVEARIKATELLTLLAAAGSGGLSSEVLCDALWPDATPENANNNLRQQINYLRSLTTFAGIIFSEGVYSLNSRLVMTDLQLINEALVIVSDAGAALSRRIAAFDRALDLYRGPFASAVDGKIIEEMRSQLALHLKTTCEAFLQFLLEREPGKARTRHKKLANLLG